MFKKKSSKFTVCSSYKSIEFEFQNSFNPGNINVKWSRHKRSSDSLKYGEPPIWNKSGEGDNGFIAGQCNFKNMCDPEMQVTLHKGKKGATFDTKLYRYTIESVNELGHAKTLGSADIDFGYYADYKGSTHYLAIDMKPKQKFVIKAILNLQVTFEFIKTANAKDADMISTFSKDSESFPHTSPDLDSASTLGLVIDQNQFSLAHQIQHYHDDVILPGASNADIFNHLPNCKLIILIFDGRWIEKSPKIVQTLNMFYNQLKMKFFTSLEVFYVSMDRDDESLIETIQNNYLKCAAVKPQSQLSNAITQHYEIIKAPHMLVLSESRVVNAINGDTAIIEYLDSTDSWKMVEKWITASDRTFSISSFDTVSCASFQSNRRVKDLTSEILKEKEAVITCLEADKAILSSSNAQLEDEVSKLNDKLVRQTSFISDQAKNEKRLTQETKLLEAERDVRGTLMKRGVRGVTASIWRHRFFQYEDNKILYIDPKTNETKGFISVPDIISIHKFPKEHQDKNCASFTVTVPGRVFEMQARDADHMSSWINAVEVLKERCLNKPTLRDVINVAD
ncbi:hypothetical protein LOD99_6930 [Oopsacas minuta]|uniref:PH domain-containing protein n=1 Tax=Oopsacas minuta TaxID=111878 RepID=A0AAV7JIY6_9METZ|nr:hypothetical protein LOD99_6930 [Oopsacas minuta]